MTADTGTAFTLLHTAGVVNTSRSVGTGFGKGGSVWTTMASAAVTTSITLNKGDVMYHKSDGTLTLLGYEPFYRRLKALGFDPEELPKLFGSEDLSVTRWGTLRVDHKTMMTSLDGVFAAGDIVRGASLVVWAIRDGRDVTEHMHRYLRAKAKAAAGERVAA